MLLTWLFRRLVSSETLVKSTCSSNTCSILHQLNTKPNKIKSHKIQGIKLKQLQYFLSWNKINIKHSCKSQLYTPYHSDIEFSIDEIYNLFFFVECPSSLPASYSLQGQQFHFHMSLSILNSASIFFFFLMSTNLDYFYY